MKAFAAILIGSLPALAAAADAPAAAASPFGQTYKIKVVVTDLQNSGVDPNLHPALTATVPETIDALGPFRAVSMRDVVKMIEYRANAQAIGCSDPSCMSELGDTLGADLVVAGSLTRTGDTTVIQLQLLDPKSGKVENRVSRDHLGGGTALFDAVRGAAKSLMAPILGQHAGQLRLLSQEEGATVSVDGSIVGVTPIAEPLTLPGGNHLVELEKRGFIRYRKDVMVTDDGVSELQATLVPSAEYIQQYEEEAFRTRLGAWGALGLGAAALAGGIALVAVSTGEARQLRRDIEDYNALPVHLTSQHDSLATRGQAIALMEGGALASLTLGALAAATGACLWILGPPPGKYEAVTEVQASAAVSWWLSGVGVSGRF